ncbi:MAG: FAD-binding and (Fe-S)-binding domain-containing protein [Pseudomonadota bacterium]|nr:FAD-binding and (Fe-S)-binding domain-containing protein [Pseudomonadota bacterium]
MTALSAMQQAQLRQMFGDRVSFDREERRIYSHDVASIPKLIKPILGDATAVAVVQPASEDDLVALVQWANQNQIHLVPRAKATSGYGGVLPVKGGISVSMNRMRKILAVDKDAMTARVEPAVVWNELARQIEKQGLALRTYPSSAPSSTVGGWLAQGGVGYGCFEYGCFLDNVISARVVLPSGELRSFAGADLELVSDAEGITGFITEVTVSLRQAGPETVRAYRFASAEQLASALDGLLQAKLPLWSVGFNNCTTAWLRNQLPPRLGHGGHPVDERRPCLPDDCYTVVLAAPEARWPAIEAGLSEILDANGAESLDQSIADHEWQERFALMHIKRLGPSLLPAEVVVPLEQLVPVLREAESAIKQPLGLEGMVQLNLRQDGPRALVTLLGFIPHDDRTLGFGVAYALSLTLVRIAKKYGGRAFSTGLYFSGQADSVLGATRVEKLRAFKRDVDPRGIMNPRKVIDRGLMAHLIGAILPFEPVVRIPANLCKCKIGERIEGQGKRGIPDDIAWYAHACAQCGYCVDDCDQYYGRGWESESPRGRWFFLRDYMDGRAEMSQEWVENFLACTTCEMCNVTCPLQLPNESSWMKMRGELVDKQGRMSLPPFEIMRATAVKELNVWGAYKKERTGWLPEEVHEKTRAVGGEFHFGGCIGATGDRSAWMPEDIKDKIHPRAEIAYFPGCTASLVEKDVAEGTARLLCAAGVEFTYLGQEEACCGLPLLVSGYWDTFKDILRHNIDAMQAKGVKTVVTSCPACWLAWHTYYPQWAEKLGIPFDIETRHYSELLTERIKSGDLKFTHEVPRKITWHDSCHMGRGGGIYEPPRELLKAIPGIELKEMEFNREQAHCCGGVVSLLESPNGAAVRIGDIRLKEAEATGAEALAALCPCCEVQFRVTASKTKSPLHIVDLAHLAAEGLGIKLEDPTEFALEQWATFDAMIKLLKPEAMAEFMAGMLPEMIEAMPQPFKGTMKWIEHASPTTRATMLAMMRPMLPALFPRLVPGMMPKLMPDMLVAMERIVPMPDYMKEQMPELMPVVMGNLLPKMLPDVIPHLVPRMEAYLKHETYQQAA